MPRFTCRYCRRALDVEDALVRRAVVCPGCKARVNVPSAGVTWEPSFVVEEAPPDADSLLDSFFVRLPLGCLILLAPLPIAYLFGLPWLCYVTLVGAVVLGLVGQVWLLLVAFSDRVWQGFLALLIPCYAFLYLLQNWEEAKRPFALMFAAGAVQFLAGVVMVLSGASPPSW